MFELKTEHNFSGAPQQILLGSEESLLGNVGLNERFDEILQLPVGHPDEFRRTAESDQPTTQASNEGAAS